AEARGLVAGATRILTALDQTPGGVAPRSDAFAASLGKTSPARRRSRSLWSALHLTPGRAAAAAVLFVAVGTALVVGNREKSMPSAAAHTKVVMERADTVPLGSGAPGASAGKAVVLAAPQMPATVVGRRARAASKSATRQEVAPSPAIAPV